MKTDDLISALSLDLSTTGSAQPRTRVAAWIVPAVVLVLTGVFLSLGFRPDLATAVGGPVFWAKAGYTLALAGAGFWLLDRAGRPGASVRAPLALLVVILVFVTLGAAGSLMMTPPDGRMEALMGRSARVCSMNIAGLSLLAAPLILFSVQRFAPVRPVLAGAATGLLAGGLAATLYGLHCPEYTAAFVVLWYTLGMTIPAAVGAAVGRFLWRW